MAKSNKNIPTVDIQQQVNGNELITLGTVEGTPPAGAAYAGLFSLECILQDINGSGVYENTGTVNVPAWTLLGTGVASDVVNEIVTTDGGAATENFDSGNFANVLATDTVFVQLSDSGTNDVSVVSAIANTASVDIVFSGDPADDTIVSVIVKRA